jgi:hypothetical protein
MAIVRLEGLGELKKSNDLIGNRICDLLACSIVPQPITLPHLYLVHIVTAVLNVTVRNRKQESHSFMHSINNRLSDRLPSYD